MKKRNFECHVTCKVPAGDDLTKLTTLASKLGWKTSQITGDPLLGTDTFFYFTAHDNNKTTLATKMTLLSFKLNGLSIREKIEEIVFDTKRKNF
jgi:hypothetical protein